jgi:hypothetical protein
MQTKTNENNNMSYPQLERDDDVAVPQIQCDADKQGAKIFLVPSINNWIYDDVRVLAFDKASAVRCGRQYAIERDVPHYLDAAWFRVKEAGKDE